MLSGFPFLFIYECLYIDIMSKTIIKYCNYVIEKGSFFVVFTLIRFLFCFFGFIYFFFYFCLVSWSRLIFFNQRVGGETHADVEKKASQSEAKHCMSLNMCCFISFIQTTDLCIFIDPKNFDSFPFCCFISLF